MPRGWEFGRSDQGQQVLQCRRDDGSLWFEICQVRAGGYQVAYWRKVGEVIACCLTWMVDGTLEEARTLADEKARDGAE